MFGSVLSPRFKETKTAKFSCYETDTTKHNSAAIFLDMNCYYAADVINQAIFRRPWCTVVVGVVVVFGVCCLLVLLLLLLLVVLVLVLVLLLLLSEDSFFC